MPVCSIRVRVRVTVMVRVRVRVMVRVRHLWDRPGMGAWHENLGNHLGIRVFFMGKEDHT